jgi:hypothetical protein
MEVAEVLGGSGDGRGQGGGRADPQPGRPVPQLLQRRPQQGVA